jgi:hypothetical protein
VHYWIKCTYMAVIARRNGTGGCEYMVSSMRKRLPASKFLISYDTTEHSTDPGALHRRQIDASVCFHTMEKSFTLNMNVVV